MKLVKLHHDVFNLEVEITNITSQSLRQSRSVPVCTAYTIINCGAFSINYLITGSPPHYNQQVEMSILVEHHYLNIQTSSLQSEFRSGDSSSPITICTRWSSVVSKH